jgi:hypothetical protein
VEQIVRKHGRRQTLRNPILDGDGLVERPEGHRIENGSEGFPLQERPVGLRPDDCRFHEIAGPGQDAAAAENFPACLFDFVDGRAVGFDGHVIDERPEQDVGIQWIADPHLFIGFH